MSSPSDHDGGSSHGYGAPGDHDGPAWTEPPGPLRAHQIAEGELVELSNGYPIECMNAGARHGGAHRAGAIALATAARNARGVGIDVGIAWNEGKNLRSPDLVVGIDLERPGWSSQAPPLAVEYADVGQNEAELRKKIGELLAFGTRFIWVVRLVGPLRVEVHEANTAVRIVGSDGQLEAPGILDHPVPVRALVDADIAVDSALHNILARKGYRDLDSVRAEGHTAGHAEGHTVGHAAGHTSGRSEVFAQLQTVLLAHIVARDWTLAPALRDRVLACADAATLARWLTQVAAADDPESALR